MGAPNFPAPVEVQEMLQLLNATHLWNARLRLEGDRITVAGGDQPLFTADTMAEAQAFLAGCFLATFMGKDLKQIAQELAEGRFADLFADDSLAEIRRDQADYARRMRERLNWAQDEEESASMGLTDDEERH